MAGVMVGIWDSCVGYCSQAADFWGSYMGRFCDVVADLWDICDRYCDVVADL